MEKYCQNCNKPNPVDAAFCRHCASSQFYSAQQQPNPARQQNPFGSQAWTPPTAGAPVYGTNFAQPSSGPSGRAMAAAGLAVAGLFCCGFLTGIQAAIIGWLEVSAIKEGRSSPRGMWMAQVGIWGVIAGSIINAIVGVIMLFMMNLG